MLSHLFNNIISYNIDNLRIYINFDAGH